MPDKDLYAVLGVKEDADQAEIKKVYRRLAKRYHPDTNAGDAEAEERFKGISEAHNILSDPEKRSQYDQMRRYASSGFGGAGGAAGFEEFFRQHAGSGGGGGHQFSSADMGGVGGLGSMFQDLFGGGGRARAHARPQRGQDIEHELNLPFDLAVSGGEKSIGLQRRQSCATCHGSGAKPGTGAEACRQCGGSGQSAQVQGAFAINHPCRACMGRGDVISSPCETCRGQGLTTATTQLTVKIPSGTLDGARLRLRGQGQAGEHGGSSGNLILHLHVAAHPVFRQDGYNIRSDAEVNIVQATLGADIEVDTLGGPVQMTIPPGTGSGTVLRLKGQGVKRPDGKRGNHLVSVKIVTPRKMGAKARDLLKQFATEAKLPL